MSLKLYDPSVLPFGQLSNNYFHTMTVNGKRYPTVTNYILSNTVSVPMHKTILSTTKLSKNTNTMSNIVIEFIIDKAIRASMQKAYYEQRKVSQQEFSILRDQVLNRFQNNELSIYDLYNGYMNMYLSDIYYWACMSACRHILEMNIDLRDLLLRTGTSKLVYVSENPFIGVVPKSFGYNWIGIVLTSLRSYFSRMIEIENDKASSLALRQGYFIYYNAKQYLSYELVAGRSILGFRNIPATKIHPAPPKYDPALAERYFHEISREEYEREQSAPGSMANELVEQYMEGLENKKMDVVLKHFAKWAYTEGKENVEHPDMFFEALKNDVEDTTIYETLRHDVYTLYLQGKLDSSLKQLIDDELVKINKEIETYKHADSEVFITSEESSSSSSSDDDEGGLTQLMRDDTNPQPIASVPLGAPPVIYLEYESTALDLNQLFKRKLTADTVEYDGILRYIMALVISKFTECNLSYIQFMTQCRLTIDGKTQKDMDAVFTDYYNNHVIGRMQTHVRIGLQEKFKDIGLQELLLLTGDKKIRWMDPHNFVLGYLYGGGELLPTNIVGTELEFIRNYIKETLSSNLYERVSAFMASKKSDMVSLASQIKTARLTPDNIGMYINDINRINSTNFRYTRIPNLDETELLNLAHRDTFITEWISTRVRDMCSNVSRVREFIKRKYRDKELNYDGDFVEWVLDEIYHPCKFVNQLALKVPDQVPDYFIRILNKCNANVPIADKQEKIAELTKEYRRGDETDVDKDQYITALLAQRATVNKQRSIERNRLIALKATVLSHTKQAKLQEMIDSIQPLATLSAKQAEQFYTYHVQYVERLGRLTEKLKNYNLTREEYSLIVQAFSVPFKSVPKKIESPEAWFETRDAIQKTAEKQVLKMVGCKYKNKKLLKEMRNSKDWVNFLEWAELSPTAEKLQAVAQYETELKAKYDRVYEEESNIVVKKYTGKNGVIPDSVRPKLEKHLTELKTETDEHVMTAVRAFMEKEKIDKMAKFFVNFLREHRADANFDISEKDVRAKLQTISPVIDLTYYPIIMLAKCDAQNLVRSNTITIGFEEIQRKKYKSMLDFFGYIYPTTLPEKKPEPKMLIGDLWDMQEKHWSTLTPDEKMKNVKTHFLPEFWLTEINRLKAQSADPPAPGHILGRRAQERADALEIELKKDADINALDEFDMRLEAIENEARKENVIAIKKTGNIYRIYWRRIVVLLFQLMQLLKVNKKDLKTFDLKSELVSILDADPVLTGCDVIQGATPEENCTVVALFNIMYGLRDFMMNYGVAGFRIDKSAINLAASILLNRAMKEVDFDEPAPVENEEIVSDNDEHAESDDVEYYESDGLEEDVDIAGGDSGDDAVQAEVEFKFDESVAFKAVATKFNELPHDVLRLDKLVKHLLNTVKYIGKFHGDGNAKKMRIKFFATNR